MYLAIVDSFTEQRRLRKDTLKVVTNEKRGGSGSWLVYGDGFGPWRSISVYFLMLPSSFLGSISVSFL
jgi:hypothetical protein